MSKLHELLAVESSLETQATKTRTELIATFEKKRHLFEQSIVTYTAFTEGSAPVTEQQSELNTSVREEILWITKMLARSWDASHHIDEANTQARSDIVIDGGTLLAAVPATSLLQLEKRVKEVHTLVHAIPTLDPAKGFKLDESAARPGTYKARDVEKNRTKKTPNTIVKYPATKEHPAQTELIHEDVPVGKILHQEWSALITPAMKADLLERCEDLQRAIKRARAKANEQQIDVDKKEIGHTLLSYIFQPLVQLPKSSG